MKSEPPLVGPTFGVHFNFMTLFGWVGLEPLVEFVDQFNPVTVEDHVVVTD